jgi:hypothetical protein
VDAKQVVDALLEYGRIDYGKDVYGRTMWQPMPDNYWISPEGKITKVGGHQKWAQENVIKNPKVMNVYSHMKQLGWVRATVERRVMYANTEALNPMQREAVDDFVKERGYELQYAIIA